MVIAGASDGSLVPVEPRRRPYHEGKRITHVAFLKRDPALYMAGFIFVRTIFVQNGNCSPFLELTPTL